MLQHLNRRAFIAGGSAALLAGCATTPRELGTACAPLLKPEIDPNRVVRSVAGLRPYRASGFVVRREVLGDKALIHNYGHGGAGITLSWGSSRLATDLGLAGHRGPVAVIGAGILGLTTARLVQDAGFPVTIYAAELPPDTTSAVAGGQVSPFGHYRDDLVTPEWRQQFAAAMAYSWRRFQVHLGEEYGVRWLPTYVLGSSVTPDEYHPEARLLATGEHPFAEEEVWRYRTMYVETPRYVQTLTRDVLRAGGRIRLRRFETPADIAQLGEMLVFNCTGVGAAALFGDTDLQPIRGQLAMLPAQHQLRYAVTGEPGYMFPRADGILLGGTFERGVWDRTPDPATIARIVRSHQRVFAGLRCA